MSVCHSPDSGFLVRLGVGKLSVGALVYVLIAANPIKIKGHPRAVEK
jgi:hypothetical protein